MHSPSNWGLHIDELQHTGDPLYDFLASASDILWETDDQLRITGFWSSDAVARALPIFQQAAGRTIREALGVVNPEQDPVWAAHMETLRQRKPFRGFNFTIPDAQGQVTWVEASGTPVFDAFRRFRGYRGSLRDITELKVSEQRAAYLARHDDLTGLPNRLMLRERVQQALAHVGRSGFAILCLDLDHFRLINDTLGHQAGDTLLREVSARMRACVREADTLARLGGDEFAIVQLGVDKPEDAYLLAQRIQDIIRQPVEYLHHKLVVGVTIGVAVAPGDGTDADELLKNADIALYRAKLEGREGYFFFEREMDARLQSRRLLESEMRTALAEEQFEVFYQPVVHSSTGEISCFEALIRWNHPTRGIVSPADFIPIAEESGQIRAIGEWVLRKACLDAASWPEHIKVAVNLSPAQFKHQKLVRSVKEALETSGVAPQRLELEITEAVLMQNTDETVAVLHQLRAFGAQISMDDFGTGYSSLSYLRSFPFDKIKIDRSFIRDLSEKPGALAIVRAIAALGTSLGLSTTAEGVETQAQYMAVRAEGCTEVQGYLFSPPVPARNLPSLLARSATGFQG